jgi:hypothetical protein
MNELSGYLSHPRAGERLRRNRQNRGMIFARLAGAAVILFGFWVVFSIVAPLSIWDFRTGKNK